MATTYAIFAGTANPDLAAAIARQLGVGLGARVVGRFPDGELSVRIEEPVRDREVFLVQPTAPPVDSHLFELLATADACHRSAAARITAVVPYLGYARSDKRHGHREPITASLVARLIEAAGIDHLVTLDLHAPQIEGFFRIPVESLTAVPVLCEVLQPWLPPDAVVVSPDAGRVNMATRYAERLGAPMAVLHKRRTSGTETAVTHLVGDVRGHPCLIVDDMITTGGTIAESLRVLREAGARPAIAVAATHGVFAAEALDKLKHAGITRIFVTDTVAIAPAVWPDLEVISVAPLLAAAIRRLAEDGSLSSLS